MSSSFFGDAGAMGVPGWSLVGTGDFNEDGQRDLVWQNDVTRQVGVWFMGGGHGTEILGTRFFGGAGATRHGSAHDFGSNLLEFRLGRGNYRL